MTHNPPNAQSIIVIAAVIAIVSVIYWRVTLRLAAIAILALTIYGAAVVAQSMTQPARAHHAIVVHQGKSRHQRAIQRSHGHRGLGSLP